MITKREHRDNNKDEKQVKRQSSTNVQTTKQKR